MLPVSVLLTSGAETWISAEAVLELTASALGGDETKWVRIGVLRLGRLGRWGIVKEGG